MSVMLIILIPVSVGDARCFVTNMHILYSVSYTVASLYSTGKDFIPFSFKKVELLKRI